MKDLHEIEPAGDERFDHVRSTFRAIAKLALALALVVGFFLVLNVIFS